VCVCMCVRRISALRSHMWLGRCKTGTYADEKVQQKHHCHYQGNNFLLLTEADCAVSSTHCDLNSVRRSSLYSLPCMMLFMCEGVCGSNAVENVSECEGEGASVCVCMCEFRVCVCVCVCACV